MCGVVVVVVVVVVVFAVVVVNACSRGACYSFRPLCVMFYFD